MTSSLRLASVLFVGFVCCLSTTLYAQNLVVNPSFETTSACPQGISSFNLATDWAQGNTGADSCSTSDLYADCASQIGGANSPNGLLGYQPSRTGTHHAGIILGEGFLGCSLLGDNYREYIEGHTSAPLVAGQKYLVRFYVSLPEGVMGGTDDIGLYFSNSYYSHNACGSQLMPVTPQLNYCGPSIMDTTNWVEVRWIYTAAGGEQYFTIGNFKNDGNTTVTPLNCGSFNPYLYYYIDDVEISAAGANDCSFALTTTTTKTGCAANDGTATVAAVGCTSPFQYTWANSSTNATITGMPAGAYTVTVTDNTSCSSSITAVIGAYTPPTLQISTINASCSASDGVAIANVLTGTGPYTYHWSNSASTQVAGNLGAGNYTVTVTGAGVCSATASASITASNGSLALTGSANPATCGNNNGSATVNVAGGGGPFTYAWSNNQTTQTINNLAAGTYTVTVTSSGSSTPTPFWSENFTGGVGNWTFANGPGTNGANPNQWIVNNNTDCSCHTDNYLHVTCNSASLTCFGNSGACTYFVGSPIPNPLFGDPTADICAISPTISTVGKSNMVLKFRYEVGGDPGLDYGLLRFSANGGTTWSDMPFNYNDSTCANASVSVPSNFENTANFKIAFRWINNQDGNGNDPGFAIDDIELIENSASACPAITSVVVAGSGSLVLTPSSTNASCAQNNGSASVVVAGSGNYSYHWSNNATTASVANLGAGTYTVTVMEGANCSATASVTITASNGLSVTTASTNASCGSNNGSATATVSGNGNYTYNWSNSQSGATISNLPAGTYNVTVNDNGCSATASAVVAASAGLGANFAVSQPSCGQANGSLNSGTITGGTQPVTITWTLNSVVIGTNTQISNLGAGTYFFHAADANGCSLDTSFILNSTSANGVTITSNQSVICSSDSAQICAPAGYNSYLWNTGSTSQCITARQAGNYYVTITDNGNCTASSNHLALAVHPQPPVSISVNGDTLLAYNSLSYQWYFNGQPIQGATNPLYVATQAGSYTVLVGDANGCTALSLPVVITATGISEIALGKISIYPNPLQDGNWTVEVGEKLLGATVELFDAEGRLVFRSQIRERKSEIGLTASRGVYMLRISSGESAVTQKLVKL